MTPFELNLDIKKGIGFGPVIFLFKQQNGDAFDLTNWQIFAYGRRYHNAKEKIDLNPVITDAANGEARIQMTDEQTLALMGGENGYDVVLQDPAGLRLGPFFAGKLTINEIYTHT